MDAVWTKEMLFFVLPVIGKLIKSIPFISNKVIPFVLAALATAKNYWVLAGFPTAVAAVADPVSLGDSTLQLAGIGAFLGGIGTHVLAIGWGVAESWLSQQIYRSAKYRTAWQAAEKSGQVSGTAPVKKHWLV